MLDAPFLQADLEWQEQCEQELVALVKSPAGVLEHFQGQELDDIVDPLGGNGRFVRPEVGHKNEQHCKFLVAGLHFM